MKNNGFTLVELLATIAIIALVGGVAVVAYNKLIKQTEDAVYEAYQNTMHAEAMQHLVHYVHNMPKNNQSTKLYLRVGDNISTCQDPKNPDSSKRKCIDIDPIKNPDNKNDLCLNSYVEVTRKDTETTFNSLTYKVCLICNDYNNCKTYDN